jgi:hypothetical protein
MYPLNIAISKAIIIILIPVLSAVIIGLSKPKTRDKRIDIVIPSQTAVNRIVVIIHLF